MNNHAGYLSVLIMVSTCVLVEGSSLRLVGGTYPWEGRVEMIKPRAGTVCDDSWGINDAKVVCRMLGYVSTQYNPVALRSAYYGEGAGSIVLDDVGCSGSETDIIQCNHRNTSNCNHREDAGVNCFSGRIACPACTCNCTSVSLPGLTCPNLTIPELICPSQVSNTTWGTFRLMDSIAIGGLGLNIMLSLVIVILTSCLLCQTKEKTSKTSVDSSVETNHFTETRPRYEELQGRGRPTVTTVRTDESLYENTAGL